MFAISRIEFYKHSECSAVFAESERTLARYDNPDWDKSRVSENVFLVVPSFSGKVDDYILSLKEKYKCRMSVNPELAYERQTNVMGQVLFTATPELLASMPKDQQIRYFIRCVDFFEEQFPTCEIISAVVHYDEANPHLHLNFLPLVRKKNSKGIEKTVFSSSTLFDGKDAFSIYQDKFYSFMNSEFEYWKLQRRNEETRPHLTVKEYKQLRDCNNPSLQMKIENAELRKSISLYDKFLAYLGMKFPQLVPIISRFYKGVDREDFRSKEVR